MSSREGKQDWGRGSASSSARSLLPNPVSTRPPRTQATEPQTSHTLLQCHRALTTILPTASTYHRTKAPGTLHTEHTVTSITIATTYIPPRTNYIHYIDMHTLLRRINSTYLLADMNAHHLTLEGIDSPLSTWEQHITEASKQAVPTITHRTLPGIKPTHETLLLQARYHHIRNRLIGHEHSLHLHRELLNLRGQIRQTYKPIYNTT
ncbi:hypothetical protein FHG87_012918 [Trinorchestia longiramus]|nr:hypothetical protein FHG87_012918 [Trinorchestia longiramus]